MPRIVRFYDLGGPENLKIENASIAEPGEGEARLRVHAVGLNRAEALYIRGAYREKAETPSRVGYEASGVVEAVGPGVDRSWVGKEVSTIPGFSQGKYGVLGETAIVPASSLAIYPDKLTPAEGASIWMQFATAWGALVHYGNVKAGDAVIITAASSSVGLAAIQIAKAEGATAIATTRTSAKRADLLKQGADAVIAMNEENLVQRVRELTGGRGAKLVFDAVAGPIVETLAEAAAPFGTIFEYGWLSQESTPFPLVTALSKGLSIRGYSLTEFRNDPAILSQAVKYTFDRLNDGRFHPKISKTFPLDQSVEAYKYLESNEQVGKVVITVD
jgi:NADPH:quinone reductase-like Zn-dependent oxidoreductase